MKPWQVAALVALAYALWRAFAPRPADAADSDVPSTLAQLGSNVVGTGAAAAGFDDVAGDLGDDDTDDDQGDADSSLDPSSNDFLGGF